MTSTEIDTRANHDMPCFYSRMFEIKRTASTPETQLNMFNRTVLFMSMFRIIRKLCTRTLFTNWHVDRTNCKCYDTSAANCNFDLVPYYSVHVGKLLAHLHIYFRWSGRSWRHCHNACNHVSFWYSVFHPRRTYGVLHEHTSEERQKMQRKDIGWSSIANESSHSCPQTAEHLPQHATLLGTVGIQKTPNARALMQRNFIEKRERQSVRYKAKTNAHIWQRSKSRNEHTKQCAKGTKQHERNTTTSSATHVQHANLWRRWWPNNITGTVTTKHDNSVRKQHRRIMIESADGDQTTSSELSKRTVTTQRRNDDNLQQQHHEHNSCCPTLLCFHCCWAAFVSSKNWACALPPIASRP